MAADLASPPFGHIEDGAWRRFSMVLPAVIVAWASILWLLGLLLAREPIAPPPQPIDARLIELPSEAPPPAEATPAPKPPPAVRMPRRIERPVAPEAEAPPTPEAPNVEPEPQAAPPTPAPPPAAAAPSPPTTFQPAPTAARALYNPLPKIPDELRDRASSAEALARFTIAADGTVSVELVTPTPDPLLNRLILETLRTWRFSPATENGKPVPSSQELRVRVEIR
ncbi:MAG TPA: TonB family protein [Burkholderiales bacterium]|nr:TonB family protein [Burkholderiales bacterium]